MAFCLADEEWFEDEDPIELNNRWLGWASGGWPHPDCPVVSRDLECLICRKPMGIASLCCGAPLCAVCSVQWWFRLRRGENLHSRCVWCNERPAVAWHKWSTGLQDSPSPISEEVWARRAGLISAVGVCEVARMRRDLAWMVENGQVLMPGFDSTADIIERHIRWRARSDANEERHRAWLEARQGHPDQSG